MGSWQHGAAAAAAGLAAVCLGGAPVACGACTSVLTFIVLCFVGWLRPPPSVRRNGPFKGKQLPAGTFDVVIVGAGPAGSTAGYFLAKGGRRVALLERKSFPRVKLCGDAWCSPAIDILEEMGIAKTMLQAGIVRQVTRGGFISPSGHVCINTQGAAYGSTQSIRTWACKRVDADQYIARAAQKAGAQLEEDTEVLVDEVALGDDKLWSVPTKGPAGARTFRGRMLLVCDGSTSYLAKALGLVAESSQPEACCTNQYLYGHAWNGAGAADGVIVYNREMLPGYSAIFRHAGDDMYLGTYVLPGGQATSRSIAPFEEELRERHPYIRNALGDEYGWRKDAQVAPIRLGGCPRSYGEQVLVVGDAAGMVDPLTGEGIHTAMIAAKLAAATVEQMCAEGDFSVHSCSVYQHKWKKAFGDDFKWSARAAQLIYRFPILLDAVAIAGRSRGQRFLDFFGEIMTGVKPKHYFFAEVGLCLSIGAELLRQIWVQKVMREPAVVPQDIGFAAVNPARRRRTAVRHKSQ